MKTKHEHIAVWVSHEDSSNMTIPIRTSEGNLMTQRLLGLLKYGVPILIPNSLTLEILEDQDSKSRQLEAAREEFGDFAGDTIGVIMALRNSADKLIEAVRNTSTNTANISAELGELIEALKITDDFLKKRLSDGDDCSCDCGNCDCDNCDCGGRCGNET